MGDSTDTTKDVKDPLYVATRAQLNFAENVPLALAIALLAELNGANRYVATPDYSMMHDTRMENSVLTIFSTYLNWALGALFAFRISHVEAGLMIKDSMGPGRIVGYYGTQTVLVALAGYTAYLVKDFLQIAA